MTKYGTIELPSHDKTAEEADNDPEAEQQDEQETEESSEDEVPFGN